MVREHPKKKKKVSKIPRQYQIDAQEIALSQNSILCLPTGSGKTFIAILVLNQYTDYLSRPISQGGKRAFFLVPTKVLVSQQAAAIAMDTCYSVGRFSSESRDHFGAQIDNWQKPYWDEVFDKFQVLVMTRKIFLDILNSAYIATASIATIIFDEAHRGAPNSKGKRTSDDYVSIMDSLKVLGHSGVRIIGLTASLINNRWVCDNKMDQMISLIEDIYDARVFFPQCSSSTCAKEIIWCYKEREGWDLECQSIPETLRRLASKIPTEKGSNNGDDEESIPVSILLENDAIPITPKQMKKTFEELARISLTFGPWSLHQSLVFILKSYSIVRGQIGHLKTSFVEIIEMVISTLQNFQSAVRDKLDSYEKGKDLLAGIPHKMLRLLQLLYEFNNKPDEDSISAIIFVERRLDALALNEWLNAVGKSIPEYSFIKAAFTIGSATIAPFPFNFCRRSQQPIIIEDFKNRKLNILVSTSVLEEGLDINHCNLIIRYDEAKTFRAYVQSKGRARSREAYFVFFTPEVLKVETNKSINMYHLTEERLPYYRKPTYPLALTRSSDDQYLKTVAGAVLPLSEVKNRVIFYCDHLPADGYTIKIPKIKIEEILTPSSKLYRCDLNLPKISILHKLTITGRKCLNEQEAEMYAYHEAVKILWAYGELDDYYRPLDKKTLLNRLLEKYNLKTDRTELKDWEAECFALRKAWNEESSKSDAKRKQIETLELPPKPGTNKKRRYYPLIYSKVLTGYQSMDSPCWLYKVILTTVTNDVPSHFGTLGLITFNILPLNLLEDKLSIFSTKDKIKVSLQLVKNFILFEHELEDIKNFQEYIFSGCLKIGLDNERLKSKIFFTSAVAPYHLLFTFLKEENTIDYELLKQTYCRRPIVEQEYAKLAGALISKNYGPNRNGLFLVEKVDYNLSPKSRFPVDNSAYDTYEDYYRKTYNLPPLNGNQPLLACYPAPTKTYFPAQPDKPTRKSLRPLKVVHLVPELCQFEYFSGECVAIVYTVPAITMAINRCLIANEIRSRLCNEIGYGQSEIPANVKVTWEHQRFTNFIPLSVEVENISHTSKPTDLSYVTCERYNKPLERSRLTVSTLSLDVESIEPMEIDDNYSDNEQDEDSYMEEDVDELGEDEEPIIPKVMNSLENGNVNNETRSPPSDPKVYSSDQMTIFSAKPPPKISSVSWNDKDIKISDFVNLEKRLAHSSMYTQEHVDNDVETFVPEFSQIKDFTQENSLIAETNSIYQDHSSIYKYGLPIELIIEALTTKKANSFINLERLEIIGDSFLKYIVSAFLFLNLHDLNEARTTWLKMHLISNFNLLHLGRSKGLAQHICDKMFFPRRNWLPPFYSSEHLEFTEQEMSDKSIADMVEAMIGAHLTCLGEDATIKFLDWLGMPLTSLNSKVDKERNGEWLPLYNDVLPVENPEEIDKIMRCSNLSLLERKLRYEFKRKDLLIEALTHPSWCRSHLNSYQRLEFLGDAILDYLITSYVFDHPKFQHLKPGELTHIRQALVNNDYFATIALVNDFHKHMFHASSTLHSAIVEFRQQLSNNDLLSGNKIKLGSFLLENLDSLDNDILTEAPKALGDIFESIAGAIFLDSGNSLAAVWLVYSPFLGNELEFFCANVPKSPVLRLFETFPDSKFLTQESNDSKQSRKRLNLIVNGWSFSVKEEELVKEGMTKRKERLSLVLSALNTLAKDKEIQKS